MSNGKERTPQLGGDVEDNAHSVHETYYRMDFHGECWTCG